MFLGFRVGLHLLGVCLDLGTTKYKLIYCPIPEPPCGWLPCKADVRHFVIYKGGFTTDDRIKCSNTFFWGNLVKSMLVAVLYYIKAPPLCANFLITVLVV